MPPKTAPPKTGDAAIAQAAKDANFLATCFMNLKSKPQVDDAAVAAKLSMSAGGVRNKLRPVIKGMEEAGALWTNDSPAMPSRGGAKAKAKMTEDSADNADVSEEAEDKEPAAPKPKNKAKTKSPVNTQASATPKKRGRSAKDADVDEEGATKTARPRKKAAKAKITPVTTEEDQDEVKAEVKGEVETEVKDEADTAEDEVEGDLPNNHEIANDDEAVEAPASGYEDE